MKRDKERKRSQKKNQRNREFVEEESGGEAVLNGGRVRGGRTLEIRDGPAIAPDPAFWLKDVSDSTPNAFESPDVPNAPDVPNLPNRYERG